MAISKKHHSVAGSERTALPGARMVGPANPDEQVRVTLLLRRRASSKSVSAMVKEAATRAPHQRKYLSREQFAQEHGADSDDIKKVEAFAQEHGLDVLETHPAQRRVVLSGTVAALSTAFGVNLAQYEYLGVQYRGRVGTVSVPEDLAPIIEAVLGLDNRPQARPHFRLLNGSDAATRAHTAGNAFTPIQVAQLYDFPTAIDGSGQCIAIIELGGGYRAADLKTYFSRLGLSMPKISSKRVDGARNRPTGNPSGPDGEVMLDIEVAGAVAPGAKIVVYFAPNTDAGFIDAIQTAIHDTRNKPSVISISWGAAEAQWSAQTMRAMDEVFQDAAAMGVTVCCASGDDGSSDGMTDGKAHVDFPAASPYALACGGTRLEGSGSTISNEAAWSEGTANGATGGGISDIFDIPAWQADIQVPPSANPGGHVGRGVPDVAGDADPVTGYQVLVDGKQFAVGGTSAVAPLWSGLIALMNQQLKHSVGYLNPMLYGLPRSASAFHDITTGNNGAYQARPGWDACTGLGSPDGARLLAALSAH